jgi:hypothetical protein
MQMIASGSDSIGNFEVQIPGLCPRCNEGVEVCIHYKSPAAVNRALKALGIDPKLPSLILKTPQDHRRDVRLLREFPASDRSHQQQAEAKKTRVEFLTLV